MNQLRNNSTIYITQMMVLKTKKNKNYKTKYK